MRVGPRSLLALGVLFAIGMVSPGMALHKETPQGTRLTSGADHSHSPGRSWGSYFAFASPVDLTGAGSVGRQAYVFSQLDYACQEGRPELRPPTETESSGRPLPPCPNPERPFLVKATSALPTDEVDNPSVSVDGNIVAFEAYGRFNGFFGGTAGARRQIFVINLATKQIIPVTGDSRGDSTKPSLNEKGTVLTFESTAPLLGGLTGFRQIFMYSVQSGQLWQVTNGAAHSRNPMLNRNGNNLSFESSAALKSDGHDTGISQIYWYDKSTETVFQMTEGNASSRNAYIDERRPAQVYFESDATNLPGTSGGPGTQIYRVTLAAGELPFVEQLTFGPGDCTNPAVDPGGGRVVFIGTGDILQNGTFGRRLFALDVRNPVWILYQITGRGTVFPPVGASLGMWFATFQSDEDVAGTGVCGRQLFMVDYDPDHYVDAGRVRAPADSPGEVPAEPEPGDPSDSCSDVNRCTNDQCINGLVCDNDARPDGASCTNGDICSGIGTCQGGFCDVDDALDCNDNDACTVDTCDAGLGGCQHAAADCTDGDPCTDDLCDPVEGCFHLAKESFEGLDCRAGNVQAPDDKRITRTLTRALRLVAAARNKPARAAIRRLRRADTMLKSAVARIAASKSISEAQAQTLVAAITDLVNQIRAVVSELQAQLGGGAK
jgi:hypothetical protein